MTWQGAFRVIIRVIFIFAYIAFLAASIRHVATFFHNFEADPTDWVNPYTLAVSIDLTALVLTVGVMFFRGNMPWYAQSFTWLFIVALTAFSWFVNWEYAMTYQGNDLHVNDVLRLLNPVLASSFAFLNLAYSVVAEFFNTKTESAAELAAKIDELEQLEEQQVRLAQYKERTRQPSVIQRVKSTALEARAAINEVLTTEQMASAANLASVTEKSSIHQTQQASVKQSSQPVTASVVSQSVNQELQTAGEEHRSEPAMVKEEAMDIIDEVVEERASPVTMDKQKYITEPLSGQASQYIMNSSQGESSVEMADDAAWPDNNDHEEDVYLPMWAGGEDESMFLSGGDTGSLSRISGTMGTLTRRKPMTVAEAAQVLELSERRVRDLRSQGILIADETNKIKVASVNAYLKKRRTKETNVL